MKCTINIRKNNLQGKMLNFFKDKNVDVAKVFGESSKTISNTTWFKNPSKLLKLLGDSAALFKEHGMFYYAGDKIIKELNIKFAEEILTPQRLISKINTTANFPHKVINSNKFKGEYYITKAGKGYTQELSFEQHKKREQNILKRNIEYIEKVNNQISKITGKQGLKIIPTNNGHKIEFNEQVLYEYNSKSYTDYLNGLSQYIGRDKTDIDDIFVQAPIQDKLEQEQTRLYKEKSLLESNGGKKSDINDLENKLTSVETRLENLKTDSDVKDIYNEAFLDLTEAEELLNKKEISSGEFNSTLSKLELWIKSGVFSEEAHLFLDKNLASNDVIRDKFLDIAKKATKLITPLKDIGKDILAKDVSELLGVDLTYEKIMQLTHKLGVSKNVLSLNRVGSALAQYIHKLINEATNATNIEAHQKSNELAELHQTLKEEEFDQNNFLQEENDVFTGKLISKFTGKAYRFMRKYKLSKNKRKLFLIDINPVILKSDNLDERKAYKNMLIDHLGELEANKYIKKSLNKYKEYKEIKKSFITLQEGTPKEKELELDVWVKNNSPVARINAINKSKKDSLLDIDSKDTFLITIPRRFLKNKKDTGFYDKKFDIIENNSTAYKYYQEAEDITNKANIAYGSNSFTSKSLAFIERSLISKWNEDGVSNFITKDVYNSIINGITSAQLEEEIIDPMTKKPKHKVKRKIVAIDTLIGLKITEWIDKIVLETGAKPTKDEITEYTQQASKEVFKQIGPDGINLFQSLNIMNLATIGYKHKMNIENAVNMAMTYLPQSTMNTGDTIIDSGGNPVGQKYINNMVEMAENTLRVQYYEKGKDDTSAIIGKVYTTEERQKRKKLQFVLSNSNTDENTKFIIKEQLAELGGNVTLNVLLKRLMDFLRLKGIGWNIPSAFANLAYGKITNLYAAADKRLFGFKELGQAERLLFTQKKKFNNILENYSILGDILYQYKDTNKFEEKQNWFFKITKSVAPYTMQTLAEKQNQGSIMIAMMLRAKVTNKITGEIRSFWEAIDETGKLSDAWKTKTKSGETAVIDIVSKIKSQVEEIHGDYTNALLLKSTVTGQALGMFKLWFFEAYHNRFGYERQDYIRGIVSKGRYRTLMQQLKETKGAFWNIYHKYKNNEMSEVDASNMRKNLTELTVAVLTLVFGALAKAAICGEDKNCKNANFAVLTLMNMSKRVSGEVTFYIDPREWKRFLSNPTAMISVLDDVSKLMQLSYLTIFEEEEDLIIKTGFYKDMNKWERFYRKQIPGINQYLRMEQYGNELFNFNR